MSHLGRVDASGGYCLNPATFAFVNGEVTFIAANGDRLVGNYDGQGFPGASPNEAGWTDVLEFTGGTGRFDGASGTAMESGGATMTFDPATGLSTGGDGWSTLEGALHYHASERRHR